MEKLAAEEGLLTIPYLGMSITTQSQGEYTMQKRPTKLLREEQCVVRFEERRKSRCGEFSRVGSIKRVHTSAGRIQLILTITRMLISSGSELR